MNVIPEALKKLIRPRTVLITGAPNFAAMQLIWRIFELEPKTSIFLVVRGDRIPLTEEMIARRPGLRERVTLYRGSIIEPNFGLHRDDFERLRAEVTDVYHMAALHHLGVAKQQVEEVNIRGTRLALDAVRTFKKLERFNHYSTAFVCGGRENVILEEDLEQGQQFRNTFERTRFTAELDVRRARMELPVSVFRPSLVVGDSRTGEIAWMDGPWIFLQAIARNPERLPTLLPSAGSYPFNVVPVDFVAAAMHALSLQPESVGKTFHLTDPAPVSEASAFRLLKRHINEGPVRATLQSRMRERMLRFGFVERMTRDKRPFLHELDNLAIFNCANTLKGLDMTGIRCPFFPDYVERLVDFAHSEHDTW